MLETLLQLWPLVVVGVVLAFDAYCLSDLARRLEPVGLTRAQWAFAICFFGPLGGLAYLAAHRGR